MTDTTKATIGKVHDAIESELKYLQSVQDAKEGSRELSVAVTNLETALLWLSKAAK